MDKAAIFNAIFWLVIAFAILWLANRKYRPKPQLLITFFLNNLKIEGIMKKVTLTTSQTVKGRLTPKMKDGVTPAEIQSADYTSSDESVAKVVEDPDSEYGFSIVPVGVGTAQGTVTADADLGEGVKSLTTIFEIEILPEQAATLDVEFDAPVEN